MPPSLRPLTNLAAAARPLRTVHNQSRQLSLTSPRRSGGHESHYEPPTGDLWGIKAGEKVEPEGWERLWNWGFFGSLGVFIVAYAFKPDTSIQTWALEEARRRLEAEGILTDPGMVKGAQNTE